MTYKVTRQYGKGSESPFATFDDLNDAKAFIELKLKLDAALKVAVTYRINQFGDVIEEFDPSTAQTTSASSNSESQGRSSSSTSRPTPFATAPRPSGMPAKWSTNEDDKDKK